LAQHRRTAGSRHRKSPRSKESGHPIQCPRHPLARRVLLNAQHDPDFPKAALLEKAQHQGKAIGFPEVQQGFVEQERQVSIG